MSDEPVLLYDGGCGFCAASVQFVLRHERRHTLRFAALQGVRGIEIRSRHPELADADSMVWVQPARDGQPARALLRSDAVIAVAMYLGGAWQVAVVGRLIPARVRDALYDLIARHRHRLVGRAKQCYAPPPAVRARFLE